MEEFSLATRIYAGAGAVSVLETFMVKQLVLVQHSKVLVRMLRKLTVTFGKMVLRISYNFNLSETINTPSIKK